MERFHQTLQRELLDDHRPFASIADAQAVIDVFRHQYNTDRPHPSLNMWTFLPIASPDQKSRAPPARRSPDSRPGSPNHHAMRHDNAMDQGPVFTDPWWDLRSGDPEAVNQRNALEAELTTELSAGHPLHGQEIRVVARSEASDDIVVRISDGNWGLVHLTWKNAAEAPPWPWTTIYTDAADLERELNPTS